MNKKRLFTGLLALLLVFALLGCEQVTSGTKTGSGPGTGASPDDTWTKVNLNEATGLDVFTGKWKSSSKIKQTVENVEYDFTAVQEVTYPASGLGADGEAITGGVKLFTSMGGAFQVDVEYMEIAEFIIRYCEGADVYVNQSKTQIKTKRVNTDFKISTEDTTTYPAGKKNVETDEEWKTYQEEFVKKNGELSGDVTVTFSTGAPYTVTITTILHKQ